MHHVHKDTLYIICTCMHMYMRIIYIVCTMPVYIHMCIYMPIQSFVFNITSVCMHIHIGMP